MKRIFLVTLLLSVLVSGAQTNSDTLQPAKKVYKYLGIQANLLVQQFISFNSNSSINTNPYVFSYSKNNIKTGKGIVFGTGFNVSDNSSNDGVSASHVQSINSAFRIGFEKKYFQEQRLIPFWGIEFGAGIVYTRVESSLNQTFATNRVVIETTKFFAGPSFRGGLNVALSKHILLGTEFFFNLQAAYSESNSNTAAFRTSFAPLNIGFQAPTALFLIFRY